MRKYLRSVIVMLTVALTAAFLLSAPACSKKSGGAKKEKAKTKTEAGTENAAGAVTGGTGTGEAAPTIAVTATTPAEVQPGKKEPIYTFNVVRSDGQPKRDPFTPIKMVDTTPATNFDVSQLGVNGVIIHGTKKANLVTPDCSSLNVIVGDSIGINDGVVVDITFEGVKVRESYIDIRGQIQEYERVIKNQPYSCKGSGGK